MLWLRPLIRKNKAAAHCAMNYLIHGTVITTVDSYP